MSGRTSKDRGTPTGHDLWQDQRIVLTLDAGGTNLVFSALQAGAPLGDEITLPARPHDLDACLAAIVSGFEQLRSVLAQRPNAISFAFPGPADYPHGVVEPVNFPSFAGGVALGPMLEEHFKVPVFVNNDGSLFTYGEAIAGLLPEVNRLLEVAGSPKRYHNLLGVTLGTGLGGGAYHDGRLVLGDNSLGAEIWVMRNRDERSFFAEEGATIRAVRRVYAEVADIPADQSPQPRDIARIAAGEITGNKEAARAAFSRLGRVAGDAIAHAITVLDGLVVIGGGLTGAHQLFLPELLDELNSSLGSFEGREVPRLCSHAFNLEDARQLETFLHVAPRTLPIPGSNKTLTYDAVQRIGVGVTRLGTSRAAALGAYAFALHQLDG